MSLLPYLDRFEDVRPGTPCILRAWHGTHFDALDTLRVHGFSTAQEPRNPLTAEWAAQLGGRLSLGPGVYFTDEAGIAEHFGPVAVPVEVTLQSPYVVLEPAEAFLRAGLRREIENLGHDAILLLDPEWRQGLVFHAERARPLLNRAL